MVSTHRDKINRDRLMHAAEKEEKGSIVSDDEPGTPRRTAVRVMHDTCSWLLELCLPLTARQAFVVSQESERLAVKKAQVKCVDASSCGQIMLHSYEAKVLHPERSSRVQRESRALSFSLSETSWKFEDFSLRPPKASKALDTL